MKNVVTSSKPKIVVLGGGFGGLETALNLRARMPNQADITLVSDKDYFLFKPNTIYIPFGLDPGKLAFHLLRPTHRRNVDLINATAREIDPISRQICLDGHNAVSDLSYDYLVVATGAATCPQEIPGLREFGNNISTIDEMLRLRADLQKLVADVKEGKRRKVLFLVPPNSRCSGPLYEMALMLDTWLRRKKIRDQVDIAWSTYEESYIQAFGPRMHDLVTREFEQRAITGHTLYAAGKVEQGAVIYTNGDGLPFDLLVSLPPYAAATHFTQLPIDDHGFIATDLKTRRVVGYPDIFAVGDAADFPMKQAFLAFLQADAAADHLSAQVLGTHPTIDFDPVSVSVMDQFDSATGPLEGAKVPLRLAGDAGNPPLQSVVRTGAGASDLYRVGSSPVWRLGKMALGLYLPWRFKAGNPLYSGVPWKGMEAGLRLVSGLTTR